MKTKIEKLKLFNTKKDWIIYFSILFFIFISNVFLLYSNYKDFKSEELFNTNAYISNVYHKEKFQVLKLENKNITFFTSDSTDTKYNLFDLLNITILTKNVNFIGYVRGFYTNSFNIFIEKNQESSLKNKLHLNVNSQHKNKDISSLYNALFFAIPLTKKVRELCSIYGISHLIAISGFHLSVISLIIYWIFYYPYSVVQRKYFPYRNKKFDLLFITSIILLFYLIFTDLVPSLLRAFLMYIVALYFLRFNIKIFSFETLMIIVLFILAFFPEYIFSISLWFSVVAVFYIFLYLQYFNSLPKLFQILFFNFWIYLVMNPISHYFFGTTSFKQLFSPFITIAFTIFYPVEAFAHLIGFGGFLDNFIELWFSVKTSSIEIFTPFYLFYSYILISILSIWSKKSFILLNILFVGFNIYLYYI